MATLRSEILRNMYNNASTRISERFENIQSNIRLFGHSFLDRVNRLQNRTSSASIINNDIENSTNNDINAQTNANNVSSSTAPECLENRNTSQPRHSNRSRSNRRDRIRNVYRHSYPHGMISIRTLEKDRNILAAILTFVVVVILGTALTQFKWFSIYGDMCDSYFYNTNKIDSNEKDGNNNFGSYQIREFHPDYPGEIRLFVQPYHSTYSTESPSVSIDFALASGYRYGCATPQILTLKRTIIGVCFLAIMCSLIQFFMDVMGAKRKWTNYMRAHAVGNILTVLLCVLIIGLCYFVSVLYERAQLYQLFRKWRATPNGLFIKHFNGKSYQVEKRHLDILNVREVKFELSYYLVTLAGFLSILAAAVNLFRKPRQIFIERIGHNRHQNRPAGDESSLLNSDLLNNEPSSYYPFYHPNNLIFNPNWNSFYNLEPGNTNGNTDPQGNVACAPPVMNCPPPPPYSP